MDKPLITIGITCFNAQDSIAQAVNSALAQTWPNFEIVIVDDGSTDQSRHMLEKIAAENDQVHVIFHSKNKGFPAALNTIFEHAKGEFVALFDDDDCSRKDRLEKQYERLVSYEKSKNTQYVMCYTNRNVFKTKEDEEPAYTLKGIGHISPEPYGVRVADYLLWSIGEPGFTWGMFGSCTLMTRPQTIKDLGGFDEDFRRGAEWDLAIRAALEKNAHFITVNEPLISQIKTLGADKEAKIPLQYMLRLRDKHKAYLVKKGGAGLYWAAMFLARARFAGSKDKKMASYFFRFLNLILVSLSPQKQGA